MRDRLLSSIAETISDYREDEMTVDSDRIEKWVCQFSDEVQIPILQEMDHVLKKTYFSKKATKAFLENLFKASRLVGDDPCSFWQRAEMLDIQNKGNSQKEMVALFNKIVNTNCSIPGDSSKTAIKEFVYLDDGLFSGFTIIADIKSWIINKSPISAKLHIITIAQHAYGCFKAGEEIEKIIKSAKKNISVQFWHLIELEDRKRFTDSSDVLRPCLIPDNSDLKAYIDGMKFKPHLRKPGQVGNKAVFSSDEGRQLLEREFLLAGVKIRQMCPYLNEYQRPLGNSVLETLGFGSLFVTFRNCPNNAPLVLWAGDPWYPLFPRKINSETSLAKYKKMLDKAFLLW